MDTILWKGGSSLTDKKEELEKRVKRLEKQLKHQTQQHKYNHSSDESKEYSRRSFLKTMASGAAGLGAAAMIGNASAFRINSDQGLKYYNSSSANKSQFNVSPDGVLDAKQIGTESNPVNSTHSKTTSTGELLVTNSLETEGRVSGTTMPTGQLSFAGERVGRPFGDSQYANPDIFHCRHFDDGEYRVLVNNGPDNQQLYTTSDFENYTLVSSDILPESGQIADHVVLADGTFVVYITNDTTSSMRVFTGSDLQNLTLQGEAVPEPDGGAILETVDGGTDVVHIYPEDSDNVIDNVSSNKLSHWTTPANDLTNATQQSDAIDVTDRDWHTGDPDLIQVGDWYYMFFDNAKSHPAYNIALATSRDLYNWQIIHSNITPQELGGDLTITQRNGFYEAMVEYDGGGAPSIIGHWRLWPAPQSAFDRTGRLYGQNGGPSFYDAHDDQIRAEITHDRGGGNTFLDIRADNRNGTPKYTGIRLMDKGSPAARFNLFNGEPLISGAENKPINIAIPGTGSNEVSINPTGNTQFDRGGTKVLSLNDDQSADIGAQDLSTLTLGSGANGRIYRHNGASSITADGGTTTSAGYYVWDNSTSEFKSMVQF